MPLKPLDNDQKAKPLTWQPSSHYKVAAEIKEKTEKEAEKTAGKGLSSLDEMYLCSSLEKGRTILGFIVRDIYAL